MSKLTNIEELEQRQERASKADEEPVAVPSGETIGQRLVEDANMTAEQEESYHGLDSQEPMGMGHKSLIIVAGVVLAVAILYIVNSWIHFI